MPREDFIAEELIHLGKVAEWVKDAPVLDHVLDAQFYVPRVYVGYTDNPKGEVLGYFYEEDAGLWMFRLVDTIEV